MKKSIAFAFFLLCCIASFGQDITLTFSGKNSLDQWVKLDKVVIENLSQNWQEVIVYPDTVLQLGTTAARDFLQEDKTLLVQNVPNPFEGSTEVTIGLADDEKVQLDVFDLLGKHVMSHQQQLTRGKHLFRVQLSTPQTYMLSVKTKNHYAAIKMINLRSGGADQIVYAGSGHLSYLLKTTKGTSAQPFNLNDTLSYEGYATIGGREIVSEKIVQAQNSSENFVLLFTVGAQITTENVTEISYTSAKAAGNLISTSGLDVVRMGVCYAEGTTPTIDDSLMLTTIAVGEFTVPLSGLSAGTSYQVRAFVTTTAGTFYGESKSFKTKAYQLPSLTTRDVLDVSYQTAQSGGMVMNGGGAMVTARGVCWSTEPNPTIENRHTVNGSGLGSFTSLMDSLTDNTQYYVRAYAENVLGVAYGNEVTFKTLEIKIPEVQTAPVSSISTSTALCGGKLLSTGGSPVTEMGICWSTEEQPDVSGMHIASEGEATEFTLTMNALQPTTTYYVRAYAINSKGVAYGDQVTFTTSAEPYAVVRTAEVSNIACDSAVCGGEVLSDAGVAVTARGVCWSTSEMPTLADAHTVDGAGLGSFVSVLTDLTPLTTYYVRAYATNATGTTYGQQQSFMSQIPLAQVTTGEVTEITKVSATGSGLVVCENRVTAYGLCWNTQPNPTLENSYTDEGAGVGPFYSVMTGLSMGNTYYVRAYATNAGGTAYGNEVVFEIPICNDPVVMTKEVTDINFTQAKCGGTIIDMGTQTVHFVGTCYSAHGEPVLDDTLTKVVTHPYYESWTSTLTGLKPGTTYYVRAWAQSACGYGYGATEIFTTPVATVPVVSTYELTNITTSSVLAHGEVLSDGGKSLQRRGFCWSEKENPNPDSPTSFCKDQYAHVSEYQENITGLEAGHTYYLRAFAANELGIGYGEQKQFTTLHYAIPTVTTSDVAGVSAHTAMCGGIVIYNGGLAITERGVCYATTQNPDINGPHAQSNVSAGEGVFTVELENLTPATNYYYRAYAVNDKGIAYGEQKQFSTIEEVGEFVCGKSTMKDVEGHEYYTVQMGTQCWMAQNLRTRKFADGTPITFAKSRNVSSSDDPTPKCYYPNMSDTSAIYGLLYNTSAFMNGEESSNEVPSGVQGVCPDGWHLPSHAEFDLLVAYTQEHFPVESCDPTYVAKSWASSTGWTESSEPCTPGYQQETNNSSGMNCYPAGMLSNDNNPGWGQNFYVATSTIFEGNRWGTFYMMNSWSTTPEWGAMLKYKQIAVRCLKN